MLKIEQPKSLAEVVTSRLRREIIEGEFELGQALSESKMAERYDVSRTPIREAFAALSLEGLVRTEPQYGTFVFTMTKAQFAQLSEARAILETAALRLSVERDPQALIKSWKKLTVAMTKALEKDDAKLYSRLDGDFHNVLFDLAANPFLAASRQSFLSKMAAVRHRLGSRHKHMEKSYAEHLLLLDLIQREDLSEADVVLDDHIRHKGEAFWAELEGISHKSRWDKISELAE
jgi:DNA-binding GntR family transcriptional regulator